MKILALDTSSLTASVAVTDDTKLLGEYTISHKKTHSEKLIPMINTLMRDLNLTASEIDIYACSVGPGSFTGLRIGITSIKSMAYAMNKPVVSVPTLDALAYNVLKTDALICPIMDARNNQVYSAIYKWNDNILIRQTEQMGIHIDELLKMLIGNKVIFVGDAFEIHRDYLIHELQDNCEFVAPNFLLQRAYTVALVAYKIAQDGGMQSSFDMVPNYLRKSQAERELDKKNQIKNFKE